MLTPRIWVGAGNLLRVGGPGAPESRPGEAGRSYAGQAYGQQSWVRTGPGHKAAAFGGGVYNSSKDG